MLDTLNPRTPSWRILGRCCFTVAIASLLVSTASFSEPANDDGDRSQTTSRQLVEALPDFETCESEPATAAAQCRTAPLTSAEREDLPIIAPSLPGEWRRALKTEEPIRHIPGSRAGQVISPGGPIPYGAMTQGRWLAGYRPGTPEAQREFRAWKQQQLLRQAGRLGASNETSSGSSPATNLWSAGITAPVVPDEEPIDYKVHAEKFPATRIDLRNLPELIPDSPKMNGPKSDYHSSGLTKSEYIRLKELVQSAAPTLDGQEATQNLMRAPTAQGVAFDAIGATGSVPPDPIMAAGPDHLVAVVNSRYRVWNKTGSPLTSEITLNTFFSSVANCLGSFDPYVDYDEEHDRFVLGSETIQVNGNSYFCIAASQTGDPTGAWNVYSIRNDTMDPATHIDYPHMGIGLEAVYISGNMFTDGGGFNHIRVFALDKTAMYSGAAVTMAEANLGGSFFTGQPTKIHGFSSGGWPAAGSPHHIISANQGGTTRIWRWVNPFVNAPTIYGTLGDGFNGPPPNAPESDGGLLNDTHPGAYMDAEYRDGKLWATRAVGCNFGGGSSESCIDWLVFDVSGATPVLLDQQTGGAYGSADDFRYFPDISVDRNNNIAIGYTKSSTSTFTELWITGREFGDTAGELQPEVLTRQGLGNYTDGIGCNNTCDRFGDYSGMTIGPDGCTFWYIGEFSDGGSGNWDTHISNFKFDSCSVDSQVSVEKAVYSCDDTLTITVTDNIRQNETTVSEQTAITSLDSGAILIDSETIPVGNWVGSDCVGADCGTWTASIPVNDDTPVADNGAVNVANEGSIRIFYADLHPGHADQVRTLSVNCQTRFEDGGFNFDGGCEQGTGTELYRDYLDAGEFIAYTFGIFNPPSAPPLTDVTATLSITGPAAAFLTIYNPTVHIGPVNQGLLSGAVFNLAVDPAVDSATFRLSQHDFELSITSPGDGLVVPQILTQQQLVQTDDNIVTESQCFNFESDEGFVNERYEFSAGGVNTVTAPWTRGAGCLSETRTDHPMTCDVGGTNAFKSNSGPGCGNFTQSPTMLMDDLLYSPIFSPVHTGDVGGQPWNFQWTLAEWFFFSDMVSGTDVAAVQGMLWDAAYTGTANPAANEIDTLFPLFTGYSAYSNQVWDSGTAWDPNSPPLNYDAVAFSTDASGEATPGLAWRWVTEVFDVDFGSDPTTTPATGGLVVDNLNLVYDQYHAVAQFGVCSSAVGTLSFDQPRYESCRQGTLDISLLDDDAVAPLTVTITSDETGDSETLTLTGAGPHYTMSLSYDTAGGAGVDDGVLFVTPADIVRATYDDLSPVETATAGALITCSGGDVIYDGIAGFQDNGDSDAFGDTNESIDLSIILRNDTNQPLTNAVAIISTEDATIECLTKDTASFGTIAQNGGTASNDLVLDPFSFKVAASAECADPSFPPTATFNVFVVADGFDGSTVAQKFTLRLDLNDLGSSALLTEDFGIDPPGFTRQLGPGDDDGVLTSPDGNACSGYVDESFWRGTGGNPGGAIFVWTNPADDFPDGGYSDLIDSEILSPTVVMPAGATSATLLFDHEYQFDSTVDLLADGVRVDFRVNGGAWQKMTTLPYDGPLVRNFYCNTLCNNCSGPTCPDPAPCFSEDPEDGENVFSKFDSGTQNWIGVSGEVTGLTAGDQVQFRWRIATMNLSFFGFPRIGGYGLDNVAINASAQECDTAVNPDVGCGVVFSNAGNLIQLCGNDNAVVEPSEIWSVDVTLKNVGDSSATGTVADLGVNGASAIAAAVSGNPGAFGTIAADGGTSTATYQFEVSDTAVCIDDITFDIVNMSDNSQSYPDTPAAFLVQVGEALGNETADQVVDPLDVSGTTASSDLSPAFGLAAPVDSATLNYNFSYTNSTPNQTANQTSTLSGVANITAQSTLSTTFTISGGSATSASLNWASLGYPGNVDRCTRVYLITPNATEIDLKVFDATPSPPYDVLAIYQGGNGGPGQYSIGLEERSGGGCNSSASLSGTSMNVVGTAGTGDWTTNVQVSLFDGSTATVLKAFGVADANPYDVTGLYTGPGTYQIRIEEAGGGGTASVSAGQMNAQAEQCEIGCTASPAAPPVADGVTGNYMTVEPGAGPDDLVFNIDSATCSDDHAVVLWGNIGDFSGYQGAVDVGCDIGAGLNALVTHVGSDIWFNVVWVTSGDAAGLAGFATSGSRTWNATGLCNVTSDNTIDNVCN